MWLCHSDAIRAVSVGEGGTALVGRQGSGPELEGRVQVSTLFLPAWAGQPLDPF